MRKIGFLSALAIVTAAPAMAMNSERNHSLAQAPVYAASSSVVSGVGQPCRRVVDRFGNVRIICPTRRQARAAWLGRRRGFRHNFAVFYRDGGRLKVWGQWRPPRRR